MGDVMVRYRTPVAWPDEALTVTLSLPRRADSVPVARHLVRHALADWKLPDLGDRAELVVTELVSNTVRHARASTIRVTVRRLARDTVRVAVIDMSRTMPVLIPFAEDAVDGRGLAIVDAVSTRWGTDRLPWGKRIWADLKQETADVPVCVPMYSTLRGQVIYVLIVVALAALLVVLVSYG
ncbi:ATP-binding protein [Streptomyces sp. NPDC059688]|uniref:ATP-binding protein n=1 Tax=Streptomyces sp. NPDC059688 TaxID=3346906 RepID=UPI003678D6CD